MNLEKIGVIEVGYIGHLLVIEFGELFPTLRFDINTNRIDDLKLSFNKTSETSIEELASSKWLTFSSAPSFLRDMNYYIINVSISIDKYNQPNLSALISTSEMMGKALKINDIIIYESTEHPNCTDEICVSVLAKSSGLKYNVNFFCGYSPKSINLVDKVHLLKTVKKVTSGRTNFNDYTN